MFAILALLAFVLALVGVTVGTLSLVVVGLALLAAHFVATKYWVRYP